jgi:hypothetical protein
MAQPRISEEFNLHQHRGENIKRGIKAKVKFTLKQSIKAQIESGSIALFL